MNEYKSFYKTVGGGEGSRCNYPTRLDVYGCGCAHDCSYCLSPDTRILMWDGKQKPISEVSVGDEIYGMDENRKLVRAVVLNKWGTRKPAYRITLRNGTVLVCSGDHRWLSNRGWKYTTDSDKGLNRSHLTNNNYIIGFRIEDYESYAESELYMMGYCSGAIRGDANLKVYSYDTRRENEVQYHFRFAVKNENITRRLYSYLERLEVQCEWFRFKMGKDRGTGNEYEVDAIRTSSKPKFDRIQEIIEFRDDSDFRRGFVAGLYDAEGYQSEDTLRVFNTDETLLKFFDDSVSSFGFNFKKETSKEPTSSGKTVHATRILGDIGVRIRFNNIFGQIVSNQVGLFEGHYLKSYDTSSRMIESIEPVGEMDLVDITTSTENFIAEGCVSHNCYARSLLDFRGLWKPDDVAVADKAKICRRLDRIPAGTILRLGGMTDPFQPIESRLRMNRWLIGELNKRGIGYLIVTKGASVADCLDVMDPELAHVQISYTYTEGLAPKGYEKASPPETRLESAERIRDGGIDVQLRLSPYIPEYIDQSRIIDCGVDRLLVEFLRINPFIEKSMRNLDPGFNFMPYMEKVGGYRHLPLEYKKILLQPFVDAGKRVTVCEDHPEHYEWFKANFNPNPDDCCDLRR